MPEAPDAAVTVFYSYAHKDEALLKRLQKHMSSLRNEGLIKEWYDRQITAGAEWEREIDSHIDTADLILLLISANFMASDYCYGIEMKRAMERQAAGQARVIPIILRPVDWHHAPFGKLQALPSNGKPVVSWSDPDEAFVDIAQGLRTAIEQMPGPIAQVDPTRFPRESIRYFMPLQEYLASNGRRFPNERDYEHDLVYLPERYAEEVAHLLQERRRALLVGSSAAGKTVLAITLGRHMMAGGYSVVYKDVSNARLGEGQKWYELMHTYDRRDVRIVYILDNCHLAAAEVNEFCFQWQGQAPQHVQCMLLSRPLEGGSESGESEGTYFEACQGEMVTIKAEDIWWGVLKKYEAAYRRHEPARYLPLEQDKRNTLRRQNAHNLVLTRCRLEIWRERGGALSDVRQEAVYQQFIAKYTLHRWKALPTLCALRQYEIHAHNTFVETMLPQEEVRALLEQRLLTHAPVENYGECYDLVFHPAEAREIFAAYVYRQYGNLEPLYTEIVQELKRYLSSRPANFMQVYENLHNAPQSDRENVLQPLTSLLLDVPSETLVARATASNIVSMLNTLRALDYPPAKLKGLVTSLPIERIAQQSGQESLQQIAWLLNALKRYDVGQARKFLKHFPLQHVIAKAKTSDLSTIEKFVRYMHDAGYEPERIGAVIEAISVERLLERAAKENLQHLYWLLLALQRTAPAMRDRILAALTPAGLAALCRSKGASAAMVEQFRRVSEKSFWRQLLREFSAQDIAALFQRSPLGSVGIVLQHDYPPLQRGYVLFQAQGLKERLTSESLDEIGKFLHRIRSVPAQGTLLARAALQQLATVDLTTRVAGGGLQQYALLLYNINALDHASALRLLAPLQQPDILQKAISQSDIDTLQKVIHNAAEIDPMHSFAMPLQDALRRSDLTEKLAHAPVAALARFLWNVYSHIDHDLAQDYCRMVDAQERSQSLREAELNDLGKLLWNLTSISTLATLHISEDPVVRQRFIEAWHAQDGQALVYLGILSITRPNIDWQQGLSPMPQATLADWLATRVQEQNPYTLALTLRGLRLYHEEAARELVRHYLPFRKAHHILESAQAMAITPRSATLLTETLAWLETTIEHEESR